MDVDEYIAEAVLLVMLVLLLLLIYETSLYRYSPALH